MSERIQISVLWVFILAGLLFAGRYSWTERDQTPNAKTSSLLITDQEGNASGNRSSPFQESLCPDFASPEDAVMQFSVPCDQGLRAGLIKSLLKKKPPTTPPAPALPEILESSSKI